jgi:serine/threonine-protein kinase
VRLARDAARGLGAAHELTAADGTPLGVVHRDVSPQNIMLTSAGTVKVVDFGVAKLLEPDERLTQSGYLKGKVAYMSPEQVYCEPVDARSDVFALGVVLYEATTGRHPFAAGGQVATLVNIASPEPAVPADALRPSYPAGLAALLNRALAKNPEQRPQSMRAFASELDQLVRGLAPGTDSVARHFAVALREFQRTRAATLAHYAPALQEPTAGGATGPRPKFERAVRALSVSSALLGSLALGAANSVGPRAQVEAPSHAQPRAAPVSDSPALRAYGKPKETSAEPAPTTRPARDAKGSVAKRNPRVSATSRVRAPVEELRNDILDRRDP